MNLVLRLQLFITIIYCVSLNIYDVKSERDPPEFLRLRRMFITELTQLQELQKAPHKIKNKYSESAPFFCDEKNGPGKRNSERPTSVHELRPGDIDIIMGMGDSITAGNGLTATSFIGIIIENRGLSWSIGGQDHWRKFITLPNLLKEFNSELYGYSLNTSLSVDRSSRFNVAEGGAMSHDMPYQAQVLINRLKHDPRVNMRNDWKVLTILIGANDFCSNICIKENPQIIVKNHERELLKTLRLLRDNIPRLYINLVVAPNVEFIFTLTNKPNQCFLTHLTECGCFMGQPKNIVNRHRKIIEEWRKIDYEIVYRNEFNTKLFTVNIQPFTTNITPPKLKNGLVDYSYFAPDCFHFSHKLHEIASIALWNNMLEPEGNKSRTWKINDFVVKCPTEEMPFLRTRENSKMFIF